MFPIGDDSQRRTLHSQLHPHRPERADVSHRTQRPRECAARTSGGHGGGGCAWPMDFLLQLVSCVGSIAYIDETANVAGAVYRAHYWWLRGSLSYGAAISGGAAYGGRLTPQLYRL